MRYLYLYSSFAEQWKLLKQTTLLLKCAIREEKTDSSHLCLYFLIIRFPLSCTDFRCLQFLPKFTNFRGIFGNIIICLLFCWKDTNIKYNQNQLQYMIFMEDIVVGLQYQNVCSKFSFCTSKIIQLYNIVCFVQLWMYLT